MVAAVVAELTTPERLAAYEGPDGTVRMAELFGVGVLLVMGMSRTAGVDVAAVLDLMAERLRIDVPRVDVEALACAVDEAEGWWRGLVWRTEPVPAGVGRERLLVDCDGDDGRDWWLTRWTVPSGLDGSGAFWRADGWVHGLQPGTRAGQRFAQPELRLRRWAMLRAAG